MIPVQQRISAAGGDPDRVPGDCVKCCVASVFELPYEDVPHFVAGEVTNQCLDGTIEKLDWYSGLNRWLKQFALVARHTSNLRTIEERDAYRAEHGTTSERRTWHLKPSEYPDWNKGYWIASVMSENFDDSTHAIVMLDDKVVFDPSMHPRRTPYQFVGQIIFISTDPSRCK